jgi:hypothetical protein
VELGERWGRRGRRLMGGRGGRLPAGWGGREAASGGTEGERRKSSSGIGDFFRLPSVDASRLLEPIDFASSKQLLYAM